jgi:hypothetical protein
MGQSEPMKDTVMHDAKNINALTCKCNHLGHPYYHLICSIAFKGTLEKIDHTNGQLLSHIHTYIKLLNPSTLQYY